MIGAMNNGFKSWVSSLSLPNRAAKLLCYFGKRGEVKADPYLSFDDITKSLILGAGDGTTAPLNGSLRNAAAAGTDVAGATLYIDGPAGTGAGASGTVHLRCGLPGSTGSTAHTMIDVFLLSGTAINLQLQTAMNVTNSTTNTVDNLLTILHNSSGTAANGFGTGITFGLQSSTTSNLSAGRYRLFWSDATHATRKSQFTLSVYDAGSEVDILSGAITSGGAYEVIVGTGDATASPAAIAIRGPARTGSNAAGVDVTIRPGNGTGTGGSGSVIVQTAPVAASSSTANTFADAVKITGADIQVNLPVAGTARKEAMMTGDLAFSNNVTPANVTGLAFAIGANEKWTVEFNLMISCSSTSPGIQFQLTGPASPTLVAISIAGVFNSTTSSLMQYLTAFSSLTTTSFGQFTTTGAWVRIIAGITNGANAGTVQLQAGSRAGASSVCSVLAGSYMHARRIS